MRTTEVPSRDAPGAAYNVVMVQSMETSVGMLVDGEDRGCGELLLELHRRIRGLGKGTRVRLLTTDPGAALDLPAWCHLTGHHYIGRAVTENGRIAYDFTIEPRRDT